MKFFARWFISLSNSCRCSSARFAIRNVDEHVDRTNDLACLIANGGRVWGKVDAASVRAFGDGLLAPDGPAFL